MRWSSVRGASPDGWNSNRYRRPILLGAASSSSACRNDINERRFMQMFLLHSILGPNINPRHLLKNSFCISGLVLICWNVSSLHVTHFVTASMETSADHSLYHESSLHSPIINVSGVRNECHLLIKNRQTIFKHHRWNFGATLGFWFWPNRALLNINFRENSSPISIGKKCRAKH